MDELAPKKFKDIPSASKVMATVFRYQKGVILIDCLPNAIDLETGCKYTVTGDQYHDSLAKLWTAKRPGMLTKGVVFLNDNTCPHRKNIVTHLLDDFK